MDTRGGDRIALAAGALEKFGKRNTLIIGTGTCITYDFLNEKGHYLGGGISPGIDIRFRSLHQFTQNLPLVKFGADTELIGDTTENSIRSGVVYGIISEINGIISSYREKYPDLHVVLSGGNVKFFESTLKDRIFAIPNLVLLGLYSIFLYNES
jgi:type III pantothenate kinase